MEIRNKGEALQRIVDREIDNCPMCPGHSGLTDTYLGPDVSHRITLDDIKNHNYDDEDNSVRGVYLTDKHTPKNEEVFREHLMGCPVYYFLDGMTYKINKENRKDHIALVCPFMGFSDEAKENRKAASEKTFSL